MNEEPPPIEPDTPPEAVFEIVDEDANKPSKMPYAIMSIVCLALSGALLTISIKQKASQKTDPASEVAALKIQLDSLSKRVKKKREALGLAPMNEAEQEAQSVEEIAANAQKNIQDLVNHSKSYQALLDKKDIEILQKQQEIDDLNKEVTRLKSLLQRVKIDP